MANFPPLFLNASGLPERLTAADGGIEIVVIDAPVAASPVDLFAAVTSPGGSVTMFSAYAGIMNIGAAGSTAALAGDLATVGTGIFGSTVTVGNTSAAPTLSLGGGDVTKYIDATGIVGTIGTPSVRYNATSHRWQGTDDGSVWVNLISNGAPFAGDVLFGPGLALRVFHAIVPLTGAVTDLGLSGLIVPVSAAIRVSTEITGMFVGPPEVYLGDGAVANKYITATDGAGPPISANTKGTFNFFAAPTTIPNASNLLLTVNMAVITTGAVEVEIHYLEQVDLPDA